MKKVFDLNDCDWWMAESLAAFDARIATLEAENAQLKMRGDALQVAGDALLRERKRAREVIGLGDTEDKLAAKWDAAKGETS